MGFINDFWKDIFNVLAALGSIGTFCTFLSLLRKDKEKQQQLNTLIKIAGIDEKRLKYQAAPDGARIGIRKTSVCFLCQLN